MPSHKPSRRRRKLPAHPILVDFRVARAALLDREADLELQRGYHAAAERLAHQAAALRNGSRA